ncbi:hypothetical protein ACFPMF_11240 [Larkinella bovis]|uniref:XRE family transcriptional regulator n=1 Tax=Larkinella bovis TaxID=683041 RepID=A0ABW0I8L5_9BACT
MELSKDELGVIRKRLASTDGGIKRAAELGKVSEPFAHKLLSGGSCKKASIDAFLDGLAKLEEEESTLTKQIKSKIKRHTKPQLSANV